ncbi:MAG: ABC transporter substrate-binding protein [Betaproteobacteria bacterium]|nr:ABC transporter substrate-binding protein [Betaproteobacteria bacterium]
MKLARISCVLLGMLFGAGVALAQVKIGVIASASGPTAFVGTSQKNAVALLPKKAGDLSIEYMIFDDASDPTQSVTLTKKLLAESKVDAIIGPSGSPNAMGMLQFVAEGQTPLLAPVGTTAVVQPMDDKKRWVFRTHPSDDVIGEGIIQAMQKRGVKTVGFIGRNDPYGESWHRTISGMAAKANIQIVANERYNRTDQSATGQVLKLIAAKPDAVLIAGVSADAATPHTGLSDAGFKGMIYHTHGAATPDFIKIGGKKVEGTLIVGPLLIVPDEIPDSAPSKKMTLEFVNSYAKEFGARPPIFGAGVFDAGLMLSQAIPVAAKKAKPGSAEFRVALREALEGVKELAASQGVINITPTDHSGFDHRGRVLLTVKDGKFAMVKD